ncbi:double-stranded RNA-binding protein Staufen homolog 2 isoform X8 [Macaca mulatta]
MLQINQMFSVQLSLGEQTWESEGSSIKKAQQAVANKALTESTLPKPVQKPPKSNVNNNPGSITPTVELNGLAMKRGEPAIYRPLDPKPFPNYRANYNFRGMYNQRYHCPVPKIFYVQLTVGNNEFFGEGKTRQAARHNAAMKALQALQNEPIPERSPQSGESGKDMDDDKDANKSEISLVFEIALKRNMPVSFEVIKESGPPHMKSFVTRVSVGEFSAEGEGNSKKLSKKRAATTVLQELKKLPPLPVVEKPKLFFKKRPKTIVKAGPEYGQGMNPISRLAQIQQAKKEKEPDYVLLSERGMPRRREFVMQVKVGNEVATGTGPNKKIAKKNAAEAMLLQLGYKASTNLQDQLEKTGENKGWSGPKPGFPEPTNNTPKGILHLSPDVYQEMEASRHKVISGTTLGYLSPKDMNQPSSSFFSISPTSNSSATIARELLMNGTSSTAEAIGLKGSSPTPPCSPVQPSKQLEYLARIQGFQVLGSHMGVGGASLQDEISRDCDLVLCLCLQSHLLPFTLYLTYTHALCSSSPELPHFMLLLSVPLRVCSLCLAHSLLAHRGILIVLLDSTKMSLQSIGLPKTKRELNLCFLCAVSIHCTLSHCYAYQTVSQDLFMLIYPTGQ